MSGDKGGLDLRRARRLAGEVLEALLGARPRRLTPMGGGLTNFVFGARHGGEELILRMSADPAKGKDYLKEQWAIARAAEAGVPVPEVLEVGSAPVPYMVARRVEGTDATRHPDRRRLLHELGGHARRVHGVETSGFGDTFDWSENRLSRKESWRDYLEREFRGEQRLSVLEAQGMLTRPALKTLRRTLDEIGGWDARPALNHGDLRLKNVIVGPRGGIAAVIDWEFCTSNAAPYWDLSLALHDLSVDGKEAFLEGYGMAREAMAEGAPALRVFKVLIYAGVVERAAREGDEGKLAWLRARLYGALDLHAF